VLDEDECREEYRCLQTVKMLTKQFASSAGCNGPFKLFLDDLRFGNILVDAKTFEIRALIDWEFCYAAPRQFLNTPSSSLADAESRSLGLGHSGEGRVQGSLSGFPNGVEGRRIDIRQRP